MPKVRAVGERFGAPILLALVVTVGMAIIYWPLLSHPADKKFYGYGDSWTYYGPTQFYGDYIVHQGELPLWNPLILCGQPIAGNPQYANFYLPNLVRRLLTFSPTPFKTHVGLAIMLYAHVLSAALGVYALARSHKLSRAGAFVAGIAFVFSAAFTQRVFGHLLVVMVISWLPWCLFSLRAVLRAPSLQAAGPAVVALGVTFSMAILAGTPQMTLLVAVALVVYWALERIFDAIEARQQKDFGKALAQRLRLDVLFGTVAVAVAAGLAAPLLVPALEFFADTPRGTQSGDAFEKTVGDETFSVPELLAAYNGGGNYEGLKTLSAVGLVLAVVGLFSARRREALFFGLFALLLIDVSLEHSVIMLRILLVLSPFPISSPARGMMVAVLPLSLLAGMGVDALREAAFGRRARIAAPIVAGVLGLILCILLVRRLTDFTPAMPWMVLLYPALAVALAAVAIFRRNLRGVPFVAVALLMLEAIHWRGAYIRSLSGAGGFFYSDSPGLASATPAFWQDLSREVWNKPNRPVYRLEGQINGFDAMPLSGVISTMMPGDEGNRFWRAALPEWVAASSDRAYLFLKRGFWLHSHYVEGGMPPSGTDFPPTTTVFLEEPGQLSTARTRTNEVSRQPFSENVTRTKLIDRTYTLTPEDHPTSQAPLIWASPDKLPLLHKTLAFDFRSDCRVKLRLFVQNNAVSGEFHDLAMYWAESTGGRAGRYLIPLPDTENLVLAVALDFLGNKGTFEILGGELIVDQADERDHIHVLSRSANQVKVEVRDLAGPRILSCIDFMYPGWKAYMDGKEVPILRAFTYFKAVEVPAGTHQITFRYSAAILYYGATIWLFSLLLCAALIRWARVARS